MSANGLVNSTTVRQGGQAESDTQTAEWPKNPNDRLRRAILPPLWRIAQGPPTQRLLFRPLSDAGSP